MGCGYSTISNRRGRLRVKDRTQADSDSVEGEYTCGFSPGKSRRANGKAGSSGSSAESNQKNGDVHSFNNEESLASRRRIANKIKPISGPMRPPINRSESQVDFFKMLDEKIANGKDLEEECDPDKNFEAKRHFQRSVHPTGSLSSVESEMKQSSQVVSFKSLSRGSSPKCNSALKNSRASSSFKGVDRQSDASYVAVCPSPKRNFRDTSSISMPSSRSSSSNSKKSYSANGQTHQVEVECRLDLTDDMQMNLNNSDILKDCAIKDSSSDQDKQTVMSPCRLSNGQVHS